MGEEAGPLRQIVASGAGMMDGGVGDLSKDPQDSGDVVGDPKGPNDSGDVVGDPKGPAKILCHLSLSLLSYTVCDS